MSKKLIIVIAGALIVALGGITYFTYFAPRLKVAGFTNEVAPMVKRDIALDNNLEEFFENSSKKIDKLNMEKPGALDELVKIYDEAIVELDKAKREYENTSKEVKKLEVPADAKNLKQRLVELNDFYVGSIPVLMDYFAYEREFANVLKSYSSDFSGNSLSDDATPEQAADYYDKANEKFKTSLKKLEGLKPPSELADDHNIMVSLFNEVSATFTELAGALRKSDLAKYEAALKMLEELDKKFSATEIDATTDKLSKTADTFDKKETALLKKLKAEVTNLEHKYGDSWVSNGLKFEVE